jgi:hypothetical protein
MAKTIREIVYEDYRIAYYEGEFPDGLDVTSQGTADKIHKLILEAVGDDVPKGSNYDFVINNTKAEIRQKISEILK